MVNPGLDQLYSPALGAPSLSGALPYYWQATGTATYSRQSRFRSSPASLRVSATSGSTQLTQQVTLQGGRSYTASVWVVLTGTSTRSVGSVAAAAVANQDAATATTTTQETTVADEGRVAGDASVLTASASPSFSDSSITDEDAANADQDAATTPATAAAEEPGLVVDSSVVTPSISSSSSDSSTIVSDAVEPVALDTPSQLSISTSDLDQVFTAATSASVTLSVALARSPFTTIGSATVTVSSTTTWAQLRVVEAKVPAGGPWDVVFTVRVAAPGDVLLDDANLAFFTPAPGKRNS